MPNPKPPIVTVATPHPFRTAFPRLAASVLLSLAVIRLFGAAVRLTWPWRRELLVAATFFSAWYGVGRVVPDWWALGVVLVAVTGLLSVRPIRCALLGWLRNARTRRQVIAGLAQTRSANPAGRLPRILRIRTIAVGERLHLVLKPGHSAELLDTKVEELRAAARCRDVRITRDPQRSHRVTLDVVRRDPLAATADIAWSGLHAEALSMWDTVHLGITETGEALRLSLVERSMLVGGEPGAGKSSLLNVVVSHAARCPDAQLVLIDPNEVQFSAWTDRALAYASDNPGDALDVLELVRGEIRRRLALLKTLPDVVRKVTPDIATAHRLPLWVLVIDELAFHTSVVGTPAQRNAFNTAARDVAARCRAAGIIPLMATQRPTSDVVPTSLRDLFSLRCAFRTTTHTSSDVVLGDGWARQGYSATDIDLTARGVGWLLAEGQQPQRFKAAWISDATIAELAVTTIRHRPAIDASIAAALPAPQTHMEEQP